MLAPIIDTLKVGKGGECQGMIKGIETGLNKPYNMIFSHFGAVAIAIISKEIIANIEA